METDEQQMELFVCGRLCLFGEHSDWAGAFKRSATGYQPLRSLTTVDTRASINSPNHLIPGTITVKTQPSRQAAPLSWAPARVFMPV